MASLVLASPLSERCLGRQSSSDLTRVSVGHEVVVRAAQRSARPTARAARARSPRPGAGRGTRRSLGGLSCGRTVDGCGRTSSLLCTRALRLDAAWSVCSWLREASGDDPPHFGGDPRGPRIRWVVEEIQGGRACGRITRIRGNRANSASITRRAQDLHQGDGFGLSLVDGLSRRWGVERAVGTRVWAEIGIPVNACDPGADREPDSCRDQAPGAHSAGVRQHHRKRS